ncbi:hypothetical protein K457DRAFT_425958 [Linnemannia elongata AG-77]|uniref:Uncharacterized protein n=1 Tax=Linnemannia elongata AG-77 TaxID=1314771 RepID=A0A197K010_9FUNG|nr:hypothetical protein K457DRAFT_425958 [Linnemannia elongata AG-77]
MLDVCVRVEKVKRVKNKGALSRARSTSGDSTDEDGGSHGYHDNEMMRTEGRDNLNNKRKQRKYAKITSTRRAVLTMGLTLISVVAVMGLVGCQASRLLRRR